MEDYAWLLITLVLVVFWFLDNWHAGWAWKQAKKETDELMRSEGTVARDFERKGL